MTVGDGWRKLAAITFAFLMVTSVIAPVGGAAMATTAGNDGVATTGNDTATPIPSENTTQGTASDTPATDEPTVNDTESANSSTQNLTTAPPVLKQYAAVRLTRDLSAGGERDIASAIDRAHDHFNRSLQHYTGPVRVNASKAFNHDAVGVRALTALVRTGNTSDAKRVADLLYRADNQTVTATG